MATGHRVKSIDEKGMAVFEIYQTTSGFYWEFKHHHNATSSNDKAIKRRENCIRAAREFHGAIGAPGVFGWMEVQLPEVKKIGVG